MSDNDETTQPNLKAKLDKVTKKVDPWADDLLERAKGSAWTPWILVAAAVALICFGAYVAW